MDSEFENYFEWYYKPLCMYATSLLGTTDDVEDVVMDSYVKMWNTMKKHIVSNVKSYLYASVRNACYDLNKAKGRQPVTGSIEGLNSVVEDNAEDQSERAARLWIAIDTLPERCREIFLMTKRDGMSYADVAEELHLSIKTVEAQVSKAYRILRGKVRDIYFFILSLFS